MRFSYVKYLGIANLLLFIHPPLILAQTLTHLSPPHPDWIEVQLKAFELNPREFLNHSQSTEKIDPNSSVSLSPLSPFFLSHADEEKAKREGQKNGEEQARKEKTHLSLFHEKLRIRTTILHASDLPPGELRLSAAPQANDLPQNLVDQFSVQTLDQIEQAGLQSSQLPEQPWSDYYWAMFEGGITNRYTDPQYPHSKIWRNNENYLLQHSCSVDQLSPAEKYDLLVGDPHQTLTQSILADSRRYVRADGTIETWMGICHGWAPASFMMKRPVHQIDVLAADGHTRIPFFPSDIKALASMLWASTSPPSRFIGGRCKNPNPPQNEVGRILSQDCFDTNPASWHLSVVNQIGVAQRSLIMDASFDYEVWNQPIYAYSYSYFNPLTRKAVATLAEATVRKESYRPSDPFAAYRHPQAAWMVGIAMKLIYTGETLPKKTSKDSPELDRLLAVRYLYDLELDAQHRILGGEWYTNQHPDFLWLPPADTQPLSEGDKLLQQRDPQPTLTWQPLNEAIPPAWAQAAQTASRAHQPLAKVVETLIQHSALPL